MTKKETRPYLTSGLTDGQARFAAGIKFKSADDKPAAAQPNQTDGQRFLTAFGAEKGGKWFAEGKTFSEAQTLHCQWLQQELAQLKTQNAVQRSLLERQSS